MYLGGRHTVHGEIGLPGVVDRAERVAWRAVAVAMMQLMLGVTSFTAAPAPAL